MKLLVAWDEEPLTFEQRKAHEAGQQLLNNIYKEANIVTPSGK